MGKNFDTKEMQVTVRLYYEQSEKLKRLARRWHCTPSAAVRLLIDSTDEQMQPVISLKDGRNDG